jgi:hypothetical protein
MAVFPFWQTVPSILALEIPSTTPRRAATFLNSCAFMIGLCNYNLEAGWDFRRKCTITSSSQLCFLSLRASLEDYDLRESQKKLCLKIVKNDSVRTCPKRPSTKIWSLEILGVNEALSANLLRVESKSFCIFLTLIQYSMNFQSWKHRVPTHGSTP